MKKQNLFFFKNKASLGGIYIITWKDNNVSALTGFINMAVLLILKPPFFAVIYDLLEVQLYFFIKRKTSSIWETVSFLSWNLK